MGLLHLPGRPMRNVPHTGAGPCVLLMTVPVVADASAIDTGFTAQYWSLSSAQAYAAVTLTVIVRLFPLVSDVTDSQFKSVAAGSRTARSTHQENLRLK